MSGATAAVPAWGRLGTSGRAPSPGTRIRHCCILLLPCPSEACCIAGLVVVVGRLGLLGPLVAYCEGSSSFNTSHQVGTSAETMLYLRATASSAVPILKGFVCFASS